MAPHCLEVISDWRSVTRAVLVALVLASALTSCSILKNSNSSSIPLPEQSGEISFVEVSKDPFLYRITGTSIEDDKRYFATAIQECGVRKATPSTATTRQLFVGFSNINLIRQEPLEVEGKRALTSHLTAVLDEQPVKLASVTVRREECVTDVLYWSFKKDEGPDLALEQIVRKALPTLILNFS